MHTVAATGESVEGLGWAVFMVKCKGGSPAGAHTVSALAWGRLGLLADVS